MPTATELLKDIKRVVHIDSETRDACPVCDVGVQASFEESVNHLLGHGYQLLHIGQESARNEAGDRWQRTVAVLGSA